MDYEKTYKEALERARIWQNHLYDTNDKDYADELNFIFPELYESEDERIRKALICGMYALKEQHKTCFASIPIDNAIAWLEKQGLQNPSESREEVELIPDTDKSKFAVGAYVTDDGETYFRIISYANNTYQLETVNGTSTHFSQEFIEKKYRLWYIEDAKAGDVLAARECLVLFKEIDGLNIKCYCTYHFMNTPMFHVDTLQQNKRAFCPATRKQQVLFFQKMEEAGYEWSDKDRKLIKIVK